MGLSDQINVLVAEDDADDYSFLEDFFTALCPHVNLIWVKDGEKLTELLFGPANPHPACLILDLNLPKKNGLEALKEIRAKKELQELPIIIFTTSTSEADRKYVCGFDKTTLAIKPSSHAGWEDFMKSTVMIHFPALKS